MDTGMRWSEMASPSRGLSGTPSPTDERMEGWNENENENEFGRVYAAPHGRKRFTLLLR